MLFEFAFVPLLTSHADCTRLFRMPKQPCWVIRTLRMFGAIFEPARDSESPLCCTPLVVITPCHRKVSAPRKVHVLARTGESSDDSNTCPAWQKLSQKNGRPPRLHDSASPHDRNTLTAARARWGKPVQPGPQFVSRPHHGLDDSSVGGDRAFHFHLFPRSSPADHMARITRTELLHCHRWAQPGRIEHSAILTERGFHHG